ncbi:hypothetical protein HZA56_00775 [Candidatus Poribacteria bacterium]|nr:hypothetical protein [Candidatus Poribacteria bacterium]
MTDFDDRLQIYNCLRRYGPRTVIVGPSYAWQLGSFSGIYNLSILGANPAETANVLRYCRQEDTVLYIFTLREVALFKREAKYSSSCALTRRAAIMRKSIRCMVFGTDNAPYNPIPEADTSVSEVEIETFAKAIDLSKVNVVPKRAIFRLRICSVPPEDITLRPFLELAEQHPGIVFVFHPMLPLNRVADDTSLAHSISRCLESQERIRELFSQSDLRFVDFSDSVPASMFGDFYHLRDDGKELLRQEISAYLSHLS